MKSFGKIGSNTSNKVGCEKETCVNYIGRYTEGDHEQEVFSVVGDCLELVIKS